MVFFSRLKGRVVLRAGALALALLASHSSKAEASSFIFQGQNAGLFSSANPSDTSVLMNSVSKPVVTSSISSATLIEQSIVSQISLKIYNEIFKGSAVSGSYDLGGGNSISYKRSSGYITVNLTNPGNGTTTLTVLDQ
ncbi:MAG: hypothetical protein WCI23_08660 [Chlorobiaceae bacterium]|jgi:hypothetical protein